MMLLLVLALLTVGPAPVTALVTSCSPGTMQTAGETYVLANCGSVTMTIGAANDMTITVTGASGADIVTTGSGTINNLRLRVEYSTMSRISLGGTGFSLDGTEVQVLHSTLGVTQQHAFLLEHSTMSNMHIEFNYVDIHPGTVDTVTGDTDHWNALYFPSSNTGTAATNVTLLVRQCSIDVTWSAAITVLRYHNVIYFPTYDFQDSHIEVSDTVVNWVDASGLGVMRLLFNDNSVDSTFELRNVSVTATSTTGSATDYEGIALPTASGCTVTMTDSSFTLTKLRALNVLRPISNQTNTHYTVTGANILVSGMDTGAGAIAPFAMYTSWTTSSFTMLDSTVSITADTDREVWMFYMYGMHATTFQLTLRGNTLQIVGYAIMRILYLPTSSTPWHDIIDDASVITIDENRIEVNAVPHANVLSHSDIFIFEHDFRGGSQVVITNNNITADAPWGKMITFNFWNYFTIEASTVRIEGNTIALNATLEIVVVTLAHDLVGGSQLIFRGNTVNSTSHDVNYVFRGLRQADSSAIEMSRNTIDLTGEVAATYSVTALHYSLAPAVDPTYTAVDFSSFDNDVTLRTRSGGTWLIHCEFIDRVQVSRSTLSFRNDTVTMIPFDGDTPDARGVYFRGDTSVWIQHSVVTVEDSTFDMLARVAIGVDFNSLTAEMLGVEVAVRGCAFTLHQVASLDLVSLFYLGNQNVRDSNFTVADTVSDIRCTGGFAMWFAMYTMTFASSQVVTYNFTSSETAYYDSWGFHRNDVDFTDGSTVALRHSTFYVASTTLGAYGVSIIVNSDTASGCGMTVDSSTITTSGYGYAASVLLGETTTMQAGSFVRVVSSTLVAYARRHIARNIWAWTAESAEAATIFVDGSRLEAVSGDAGSAQHTEFAAQPGDLTLNGTFVRRLNASRSASLTPAGPEPRRARTRVAAVEFLAGSTDGTTTGNLDGTGSAVRFDTVQGCAVHPNGTVMLTDTGNDVIRSLDPVSADVTYAAGGTGDAVGYAADARFGAPMDLVLLSDLNTFVFADNNKHCLRALDATSWTVSNVVGLCGTAGFQEGTGTGAQFNWPFRVAVDPATDDLYVADNLGHRIRKAPSGGTGATSTILGTGTQGSTGSNVDSPAGIAFQPRTGHVYFGDLGYYLRAVTSSMTSTSVVGDGTEAVVDGTGTGARVKHILGLTFHPRDDRYVYVFEGAGYMRVCDTELGHVFTLVGTGTEGWTSGDGAKGASPALVGKTMTGCFDASTGALYVVGRHAVSRVTFPTETLTVTQTSSLSVPPTPSATRSSSGSVPHTSSLMVTSTRTASVSLMPPPTPSPTASPSRSGVATASLTHTGASPTVSAMLTASATVAATRTDTPPATASPLPTRSASVPRTATATLQRTASMTAAPSATVSRPVTLTDTLRPTATLIVPATAAPTTPPPTTPTTLAPTTRQPSTPALTTPPATATRTRSAAPSRSVAPSRSRTVSPPPPNISADELPPTTVVRTAVALPGGVTVVVPQRAFCTLGAAPSLFNPLGYAACCRGGAGLGTAAACVADFDGCAAGANVSVGDATGGVAVNGNAAACPRFTACAGAFFRCLQAQAVDESASGAGDCPWGAAFLSALRAAARRYAGSALRAACSARAGELAEATGCGNATLQAELCGIAADGAPAAVPPRLPPLPPTPAQAAAASAGFRVVTGNAGGEATAGAGVDAVVVQGHVCDGDCERAQAGGLCGCRDDQQAHSMTVLHASYLTAPPSDACYSNPFDVRFCANAANSTRAVSLFMGGEDGGARRQGDDGSCDHANAETGACSCPAGKSLRRLPLAMPGGAAGGRRVPLTVRNVSFCAPPDITVMVLAGDGSGDCIQPLGENFTCECAPPQPGGSQQSVALELAYLNESSTEVLGGVFVVCGAVAAPPRAITAQAAVTTGTTAVAAAAGGPAAPMIQGASMIFLMDCNPGQETNAEDTGSRSAIVPFEIDVEGPRVGGFLSMLVLTAGAVAAQAMLVSVIAGSLKARDTVRKRRQLQLQQQQQADEATKKDGETLPATTTTGRTEEDGGAADGTAYDPTAVRVGHATPTNDDAAAIVWGSTAAVPVAGRRIGPEASLGTSLGVSTRDVDIDVGTPATGAPASSAFDGDASRHGVELDTVVHDVELNDADEDDSPSNAGSSSPTDAATAPRQRSDAQGSALDGSTALTISVGPRNGAAAPDDDAADAHSDADPDTVAVDPAAKPSAQSDPSQSQQQQQQYASYYEHASALLRFPNLALKACLFGFQGLLYESLVLLRRDDATDVEVVVGTVGVVLCVCFLVFVHRWGTEAGRKEQLLQATYVKYLNVFEKVPPGVRTATLPVGFWLGKHSFVRRFGALYEAFETKHVRWVASVHLVRAVLISALSAIKPESEDGCRAVYITLAVVFFAFAVLFLVTRPHRVPFDDLVTVVLNVLSGVLALAIGVSWDIDRTGPYLGVVYTALAATVFSLSLLVAELVFLRRKEIKAQGLEPEEDLAAAMGGGGGGGGSAEKDGDAGESDEFESGVAPKEA